MQIKLMDLYNLDNNIKLLFDEYYDLIKQIKHYKVLMYQNKESKDKCLNAIEIAQNKLQTNKKRLKANIKKYDKKSEFHEYHFNNVLMIVDISKEKIKA